MSHESYRASHPECGLLPCFPWNGRWHVPMGTNGNCVSISYRGSAPSQIHHIVLKSWHAGPQQDDERNVLHVHHAAHDFVTDRTRAGFVLSLYAKHKLGELDVDFIREIMKPRIVGGLLQTEDYAVQCEEFEWMIPIYNEVVELFK